MSFLNDLNPVQREAVTSLDGPVMIVAGAGSGKTRVLTYRTAHLVHLGVPPGSILALTFTNKAAGEMKRRIETLVGEKSKPLWMGTFHSFCARLLRFEAEKVGYTRNFTIYDTDDSQALVRGIMQSFGISQQQFSPSGIRSRISVAKNQMLAPGPYRNSGNDPLVERTAQVYEEYERRLKNSNAMDFDDLLLKPLELFSRHRDVLERYQYRFKYVLVDEYQDTNRVQYLLIRELADRYKNICVVGDDAQSIYAFRGADIRNILDFERDYPACKVFRLEQNYRSTQTILNVAGSVIRHNLDQIPKNLWTKNGEGEPVVLTVCENEADEGAWIAAAITEEIRRNKRDLKDFAVLYRTNAQSRSIEDALRRNGMAYILVGGVAFYRRKEIKDVLAYLRVLVNPKDDESLLRVINVPARGIGETTIEKVRRFAQRHALSLFETLAAADLGNELAERSLKPVRQVHALLAKYLALRSSMSASELARALVDELGFLAALKDENTSESLARRENIIELVSALSEFSDTRPGATLEEFLEEVALVADVDMADFDRNAVTLMTIHAAKGLEFPVVFVSGLEEGLFPIAGALEDRKELEEERRLMYVGVTRAMQKVFLSYATARYRFGTLGYSTRSRFLEEIDQSYLVVHASGAAAGPRAYRRPTEPPQPRPRQEPRRQLPVFEDAMPDYENESQEPGGLAVGTRVAHGTFGPGTIVGLSGRGDNARAIVDFDSVGKKHLLLKFAHLRLP
jgi:DNA helicase-2/ATP-dependent DNA helicase PcrA